jgi:hypothetical protein
MTTSSSPHRPPHHRTAYDVAYEKRPAVLKEQRERVHARYMLVKKLGQKALHGMDVDHRKALAAGGSNKPGNWRLRSPKSNRGDKSVFTDRGYRPIM